MKLKFFAFLPLFCCCPVVFAELVASASYEEVCQQMDLQGISSRTQSYPNSQQLVDNVVVVVGAEQTGHREQTQPVASSDIVLGARMTQTNNVNSSPNQASVPAALAADPCT